MKYINIDEHDDSEKVESIKELIKYIYNGFAACALINYCNKEYQRKISSSNLCMIYNTPKCPKFKKCLNIINKKGDIDKYFKSWSIQKEEYKNLK